MTELEWNSHREEWMPSESDHQYINSLMGRVIEPGKFANWISPPARGINNLPIDFQYVRFD
jgi:benzoyl-CoA 2,3-dioxygenase component B